MKKQIDLPTEEAASNPIDVYLAGLPAAQRAALEDLRAMIHAAAPDATEALSYGVPAFKRDGVLVSFGAAKDHCSFYVQSPAVMDAHKAELAGFKTAKGTVHFTPEAPIPVGLVEKLVKARIAEKSAANRGKATK